MKRLWFAFIFIALCVLACSYEQYVVKSAYRDIVSVIDKAIEADVTEEKAQYCFEITEEWDKYYKKVALVTDHSILESADISVGDLKLQAQNGSDRLDELLTQLKSELEHIYEGSLINLSNIF